MRCPKCQSENPDTQRFCGECGGKLETICPKCGVSNPPKYKFCGECGQSLSEPVSPAAKDLSFDEKLNKIQRYLPKGLTEKILSQRDKIEGEKRQITVLFFDLEGFTPLVEQIGAEEAYGVMDQVYELLIHKVHDYEGTVNEMTGDGVMALFGAPVAHEDHAQRACRAALAIQQAMERYGSRVEKDKGVPFAMRIGINSGPVIVGAIGDDLRMDYTAVGDTTNLAARIQQSARPGEVWLSGPTQGLISGYFETEPAGSLQLKGKSEPQPAYRVTAERKQVRTRFEAGLARGVTELVGRRPEMEILNTAWDRVKSEEARVVDVVGEAGVGKSRLIYEFERSIAPEATILTGVCITYGKNISYLPVIDVVRGAFGIQEGMSAEEASKRITDRAVEALVPMIPFYRNLLSLKVEGPKFNFLNPEGRKFGTFEAVKNLLLSLSMEKPLVVFLEDVHWMDRMSEEFFVYFSRSIHGQDCSGRGHPRRCSRGGFLLENGWLFPSVNDEETQACKEQRKHDDPPRT